MPNEKKIRKTIAVQTRLSPENHAIMTARMYASGFGLVSEYLEMLAISDLAPRILACEERIGKLGMMMNDMLVTLRSAGMSDETLAFLEREFQTIQGKLILGSVAR